MDIKDVSGKWHSASIKQYKKPNQSVQKQGTLYLRASQMKNMKNLKKLPALLVHYIDTNNNSKDEWMFIKPKETICNCHTLCIIDRHTIAPSNTFTSNTKGTKKQTIIDKTVELMVYGYIRLNFDKYMVIELIKLIINYSNTPFSGCIGLTNLGKTDYMNSVIQCISNTPYLHQYLLSEAYKSDINETNPLGTKGEFTIAFAKLLSNLWDKDEKIVRTETFRTTLRKSTTQFNGY